MTTNQPIDYMSLALQLAEQGRYTVSPNPMVGCVIVKNHKIIGQGWHQHCGGPHAEIEALQQAGSHAKGATVYVTLEPCCHQGKTPPCVKALIQAEIKEIYVACVDTNPLVNHEGIRALKNAGIIVYCGLLEKQATQLNEIFFHYMRSRKPFVIAKWAMSLDGKTISHLKDERQISNAASQHHAHQLRQQVDAIIIGANTARRDNPLLTVRFTSNLLPKHPWRIIVSNSNNLPSDLQLFNPQLPAKTIIATSHSATRAKKNICAEIWPVRQNAQQQVDLSDLLTQLGQHQITSVLVEGGMTLLHSFFRENLVNKIYTYIAPVIIGDQEKKITLKNMHSFSLENNIGILSEV